MEARPELPLPLATEEDWAAVRELKAHCRWYPHNVVVMMPNCVRRIVALWDHGFWYVLVNPFLMEVKGDALHSIPVKCSLFPEKLCLLDSAYPDIVVTYQQLEKGLKTWEARVTWDSYIVRNDMLGQWSKNQKAPQDLLWRLQAAILLLDGKEPHLVPKDYRTIKHASLGGSFGEGQGNDGDRACGGPDTAGSQEKIG